MKDEKKEFNNSLKTIVKYSFIVFLGVIFAKLFSYVYRIIIARYYGVEVYGLFSLALATILLFCTIANIGLNEGILRYVSFYRGKKKFSEIKYLARRVIVFLGISGIVVGSLLFLFSDFISLDIFNKPGLAIYLKFFSFSIPLIVLSGIFLSYLSAFENFAWRSFLSDILNPTAKVLILALLIFFGFGFISIIISYLFATLIVFIVSFFIFRKIIVKIPVNSTKINKKTNLMRELLNYSWPLSLFYLTGTIFHQTDTFILGIYKTTEVVGVYNAALPISILIAFPATLFIQLFFPIVTKEYSRNNKEVVKQLTQQIGKWTFILTLPLFILFLLFPGILLNILFGPEYLSAVTALRFLTIGALFISMFTYSKNLLATTGKSRLLLVDFLILSIFNVILNIILIPKYGINGAAFSTMFSLIILYLIFFIQTYKDLKIVPFRRKMGRIFLVSLIPLTILLLIRNFYSLDFLGIILLTCFFFLTYFLLIIKTNCLDENDKMIIDSIRKRVFKN